MTDVPDALVEKVAQALVEHPSIPANLNETMFYCPTCGADDDQIAGPNSPTHATHQARAALAAVLPDLAEEKRRAIDAELIIAAAHDEDERLADAVKDACWKATQYGETEDGDTLAYIVPKGAMHRLIGAAQAAGIPASFHNKASDPLHQDAADVRRAVAEERSPCRCVWCCQSTPPLKRGSGHCNCGGSGGMFSSEAGATP